MFLSAHIGIALIIALLPFPHPLTQKTSSFTQCNTLVLSLLGCSDAIMKVMYPNRIGRSIIKIKIKWKSEEYMCQDIKFPTIF